MGGVRAPRAQGPPWGNVVRMGAQEPAIDCTRTANFERVVGVDNPRAFHGWINESDSVSLSIVNKAAYSTAGVAVSRLTEQRSQNRVIGFKPR
jgi:hypothetical protein